MGHYFVILTYAAKGPVFGLKSLTLNQKPFRFKSLENHNRHSRCFKKNFRSRFKIRIPTYRILTLTLVRVCCFVADVVLCSMLCSMLCRCLILFWCWADVSLYIGTMCTVKFGRQWFRAVVELRNGLMVNLYYVDTGFRNKVHCSNCFRLPER